MLNQAVVHNPKSPFEIGYPRSFFKEIAVLAPSDRFGPSADRDLGKND